MKKLKLFTIATTLALASCTGGNAQDNTKYVWSKEADENFTYALGDYFDELPYYNAPISETYADNDNGLKYAGVILTPEETSQMTLLVYKSLLMEANFTVTSSNNVYTAYKSVSMEDVMVINYRSYKQKTISYFQIETYVYKDKVRSWPTQEVVSVLGQDIPHYDADYYYVQTGNYQGLNYVQVFVFGVGGESETNYYRMLKDAGYIVRTNASTCNAILHSAKINLDFYYDYEEEYLLIQGYLLDEVYTWPTQEIQSKFHMDLPIYSDPAVTYYYGYFYLENSMQYYCIQCEYVPNSCLSVYDNQLTNAGWVKEGEDVDLPEDWPIFLGEFARYRYGEGDNSHLIEVRFYDPENPLIQAVGYDLPFPIMLIVIYY